MPRPVIPETRDDGGSEFISPDLDLRAHASDVTLDFSRPGKPTDDGFIEAFSSKLRSEYLNARRRGRPDRWRNNGNFTSLADARKGWRIGAGSTTRTDPSAIGYDVAAAPHHPGEAASLSP